VAGTLAAREVTPQCGYDARTPTADDHKPLRALSRTFGTASGCHVPPARVVQGEFVAVAAAGWSEDRGRSRLSLANGGIIELVQRHASAANIINDLARKNTPELSVTYQFRCRSIPKLIEHSPDKFVRKPHITIDLLQDCRCPRRIPRAYYSKRMKPDSCLRACSTPRAAKKAIVHVDEHDHPDDGQHSASREETRRQRSRRS